MPRTAPSVENREISEDEIMLGVLGVVERDSAVTQRRVARDLGIALGLANSYVRRCVHKGYVKVNQAPTRRYAYYLTPKGFAEKSRLTASYLAHSFSFFRQARVQCEELLGAVAGGGARSIVLFGDGDLAEIVRLISANYAIKVLRTVDGAGSAREMVRRAERADHYVITSLDRPHELYVEALRAFGSAKVSAPPLLRLPGADIVLGAIRE
ncbi:MAG: winged helix-turn-helix transcriptional regulator [Hyphomicrobium sp.]|nr:winged helix-turn-helix transcriptional regulator [Hyphomicrobium sp.]